MPSIYLLDVAIFFILITFFGRFLSQTGQVSTTFQTDYFNMGNTNNKWIHRNVNVLYYKRSGLCMFRPPIVAIFREMFIEGYFTYNGKKFNL